MTEIQTITTTIKRQFLAEIIVGTKTIEYREIKPYWTEKFRRISVPFNLRLINGMSKVAPEVTVLITEITKGDEWELHIGKILNHKNWPIRGKSSISPLPLQFQLHTHATCRHRAMVM